MLGIRQFFQVLADIVRTSSVAFVTTGLKVPVAKNQNVHFRAWIPITVGAAGGAQFQVLVPAAGVLFEVTYTFFNTVAPSIATAIQNASAAVGNALANAGSHWVLVEGFVSNGVNAGNIDIQVAQNTSNAASLTVLKGGFMDVATY